MTGSGPASAGCCCCCLVMTWIIKITLTIFFLIGFALLFFWIIVNPHKMNIKVSEATLTRFNFTGPNDTLSYDLNFDVAIRNPNRIMGFYYDLTVGAYYYHGYYYVNSSWDVFYQGRKTTTTTKYSFSGERELYLIDSNERASFIKGLEQEKEAGMFPIDVKIDNVRVRVKLGRIRIGVFQPKVRCDPLKIPLSDRNMANRSVNIVRFGRTSVNCDVQFKASSIMEALD